MAPPGTPPCARAGVAARFARPAGPRRAALARQDRHARPGHAGRRQLAGRPGCRPGRAGPGAGQPFLLPPRPVCGKADGLLLRPARHAGRPRPASARRQERHCRRIRFPAARRHRRRAAAHRVRHQVLPAGWRPGSRQLQPPGRPQPGRHPRPENAQDLQDPVAARRTRRRAASAARAGAHCASAGQRLAVPPPQRPQGAHRRHLAGPLPWLLADLGRASLAARGAIHRHAAPAMAGPIAHAGRPLRRAAAGHAGAFVAPGTAGCA